MAGINDINDLTFAKNLDFQAFSKFLFGGFVGFQALIVEKIWKWAISRNFPPARPPFLLLRLSSDLRRAPLKDEAPGEDATEKRECPEIVSLKQKIRSASGFSETGRRGCDLGEIGYCVSCPVTRPLR
ncbi:MAG: hypothetical protein ABSE69_16100 [Roseiarcus sp.]